MGLCLASVFAGTPLRAQQAPKLEATAVGATDGHATLAWTPAGPVTDADLIFELQWGEDAGFPEPVRCYEGVERASFRSGLPRGDHYFRVRQRPADREFGWGPWSEPLVVEIRPYSLTSAWALFATGALLTGLIVGYLLISQQHASEPEAAG